MHPAQGNSVLACCDEELLGQRLQDSKHDVVVNQTFYGGEKTTEEEMTGLLKEANSINLLGKNSVGVAIREGLISERDVIRIAGIEHAIIMRL